MLHRSTNVSCLLLASLGAMGTACDPPSSTATQAAPTAVATTTASTTAAPGPGSAARPSTGSAACDEFLAVMTCLKAKLPVGQRARIEATTKQVLDLTKTMGPKGDQACSRGLEQQRQLIREMGCEVGGRRAAAPDGSAEAAPGAPGRYSMDGLKVIADDCDEPFVVLSTTPKKQGATYHWPWMRQALHAHTSFWVVSEAPTETGEIRTEVIETEQAYVLVARCADGATCNRLAAMARAVVRSSKPQLFCGRLPVDGKHLPSALLPSDGRWLPAADDAIGKCARLAACTIFRHPETAGDPGLECQRAPAKFQLECAMKRSCDQVVACTKK